MAYQDIDFVAFQVLTAANMNVLSDNDAFFNSWITGSRFKVGSFTISGTGSKAVTGVGFQPSTVLFALSNTDSAVGSTTNGPIAVGMMDSSGNQGVVAAVTRNSHGGGAEVKTDRCLDVYTIAIGGGSKASGVVASYTSMDSGGFTINVTTYNAVSKILYLAMK